MAEIDTSIYRRAPSMAQSMSGLGQAFGRLGAQNRQNELNILQDEQNQIKLDNMRRKQKEEDDRIAREDAFRQEIQSDPWTYDTPEKVQELYREHFPMQSASQQLKQMGRGVDPYAAEKIKLRQDAEARRFQELGLKGEKLEVSKGRLTNLTNKLKLANKMGDAKLAKQTRDEIFRQKKLILDEEDRDWKNNWTMNKTPYEYAQKQTQLIGQVPAAIRGNYRGTLANTDNAPTSQDITPE